MGTPRSGRRPEVRLLSGGARVFGRRRGRRLRPGRERLLSEALPRIQVHVPDAGALDPRRLFAPSGAQAVWLEIGFGAGEHLAWQAARHPGVGIIGVEPFVNGVAALLRLVEDGALRNVRILPDGAEPLLDALPAASIDRLFVLFPNPWPKRRHHRRRILRPATIARCADILGDGAELRFATDDMGMLRWVLFHVLANDAFAWPARGPVDWRTRPDDWPATRYEAKAGAAGRPVVYLRFLRQPR